MNSEPQEQQQQDQLVNVMENVDLNTTTDGTAIDSSTTFNKVKGAPREKKPKSTKDVSALATNSQKKKENREGMEALKASDFPMWYAQVVQKSELIEFYDVSGCYILRPWAYSMWETVREFFDPEIKKMGVDNTYFPLFVSAARLNAEKDHVAGFSPEVAWVTRSGQSELEEPVAVRPTSETIMYPAFAKWIRSHRDLPLKINQWSNVVRWEFKHPTPFLRSREFLWQEGHTAHSTLELASKEVVDILVLYKRVYEELMAVPVIRGTKSENEKFAGGLYTTTVEGFIPANGRAIQGATSHCLGQNFAKMFNILYEDDTGNKRMVWQNSWGITTRTLGVMVMVHGDDNGLVLPPKMAPVQCIIVPIVNKKDPSQLVLSLTDTVVDALKKAGVRAKVEDRKDKSPGWKFNYWELKGVPIRIEIGPRDAENKSVIVCKRYNGEKCTLAVDGLGESISALLREIQDSMLNAARVELDKRIALAYDWAEFRKALENACLVLSPWCENSECEEKVKKRSAVETKKTVGVEEDQRGLTGSAKSLCMPFDEELERLQVKQLEPTAVCFACGSRATKWCLWGRSY
mmetsp:Transcript_9069/g.16333  ORF Transcript_9069/g.16333 Transcript_9069/m.16333 type:complete len:576 (-) Transcript_9069:118-1845(-)|eukprot:CAMPEP_0182443910 /NCGR_PEP_ID=MMETSP1172-20130603/2524_1 /TAXON_ID=708627 /ORGANISM="Timspurckia oligopyrenoides, Strain CCMP3278" /LENGTH=575 /DNA_ID=CAMNT_0024639333 /DNA_START=192 /DNA_END=1919 /DNA_ORIENTATION=-